MEYKRMFTDPLPFDKHDPAFSAQIQLWARMFVNASNREQIFDALSDEDLKRILDTCQKILKKRESK